MVPLGLRQVAITMVSEMQPGVPRLVWFSTPGKDPRFWATSRRGSGFHLEAAVVVDVVLPHPSWDREGLRMREDDSSPGAASLHRS